MNKARIAFLIFVALAAATYFGASSRNARASGGELKFLGVFPHSNLSVFRIDEGNGVVCYAVAGASISCVRN